jgi:hypothetical protein
VLQQVVPKIISAIKPGRYIFLYLLTDITGFFKRPKNCSSGIRRLGYLLKNSEGFFDGWLGDFDIFSFNHFLTIKVGYRAIPKAFQ